MAPSASFTVRDRQVPDHDESVFHAHARWTLDRVMPRLIEELGEERTAEAGARLEGRTRQQAIGHAFRAASDTIDSAVPSIAASGRGGS